MYGDEMFKTQPNKMGTTPQHLHTIPTYCAILPTVFLCLLVVCTGGLWKVVGRVLLCVVNIDVDGVYCVLGGCIVVATEHGRYNLSFMQKLRAVMDHVVCWKFKLCCEILLLMNVADVDCLLCGRLWSEQC